MILENGTATKQEITHWDGTNRLAEFNPSGEITRYYTSGPGPNEVLAVDQNGQTAWALHDQIGSVVAWAEYDSSEWEVQYFEFDSFGNLQSATGSLTLGTLPTIWAGHQLDEGTGYYHAQWRWYDPETGQFLSQDPILDDNNAYRYAGNDPVNKVDPTGLAETRLPTAGKWSGEVGNSFFVFDDNSLPIVRYRNNQPDFTNHIYSEGKGKSKMLAKVEITLDGDLSKTDDARRSANKRAATAEMRRKLKDSKWKVPINHVWHHQWVDGTGKGQMILVQEKVHRAAVHKGAFAVYSDILKAREAGDKSKIAKAHKLRRTLGFIGKAAQKAAAPTAVFMTFSIAKQGWAEEGAIGAGKAVMRDAVFADEFEYAFEKTAVQGAEAVGDLLMINEKGHELRFRKRFRNAGVEFTR